MTSSVNKLFEKISEKFLHRNRKNNENRSSPNTTNDGNQWNAENIARRLGIKIPSESEVEAHFILTLLGGERIIAAGNHTIESIPHSKFNSIRI